MSDKSPLFLSAMELYAHAIELYASKKQNNYKFVILHLANAVELLLKDSLLDLGESIYKSPKETVSIWAAFELLSKHQVEVPEKQHIELLIDDRNTIQHRFGFPDQRSTYYYIDEVAKFLRKFLNERYGLDFAEVVVEYLNAEHLPIVGVTPAGPEAKIRALMKVTPPMAVVQAYEDWRDRFRIIVNWEEITPGHDGSRFAAMPTFLADFAARGYLPDAESKWALLRSARDQAAHGETHADWSKALDAYFDFVKAFERARADGYLYSPNKLTNPDDASTPAVSQH